MEHVDEIFSPSTPNAGDFHATPEPKAEPEAEPDAEPEAKDEVAGASSTSGRRVLSRRKILGRQRAGEGPEALVSDPSTAIVRATIAGRLPLPSVVARQGPAAAGAELATVCAIYDCVGTTEDELSFSSGDLIVSGAVRCGVGQAGVPLCRF